MASVVLPVPGGPTNSSEQARGEPSRLRMTALGLGKPTKSAILRGRLDSTRLCIFTLQGLAHQRFGCHPEADGRVRPVSLLDSPTCLRPSPTVARAIGKVDVNREPSGVSIVVAGETVPVLK